QHPNIVQVYEVGEFEGRPYFSLEFVEGGSLADRLKGTPQPARVAAVLVQQLAEAMHAAHQRDIVHRDLKPANVLLASVGTGGSPVPASGTGEPPVPTIAKITDFGLAKQL